MYKVCFVDDETSNYQLLEKLVNWQEKGFEIVGKASDGLEALQLYEEVHPDLILMDIQLPRMDGLECVRCIRETDKQTQIVIVSAYNDFTYAQKAIQCGVKEFLLKPVSRIVLNQLIDKIKCELDARQQKHEMGEEQIKEALEQTQKKQNYGFYEHESGADSLDFEGFSEEELNSDAMEHKIYEALATNNTKVLYQYLADEFETAAKKRIEPEILKTYILDVLLKIKFILKKFDRTETFLIMRNIRLEEIYNIYSSQKLFEYARLKIERAFGDISKMNHQQDRGTLIVFQANAFAELHFAETDFSLKRTADTIGISKNYFASLYKEKAGISFWEHLTALRMEKAKEYLLVSDDTMQVIARRVGYESEYHFSRRFKELIGETPNQYRRNRNI